MRVMSLPPEESLLANVPAELRTRPEAQRAAQLVVALQGAAAAGDPFETFAELDALPADVVRAVLSSWTGAPPDPEALDEATRRAHGFPPPPMHVKVQRAMKAKAARSFEAMGAIVPEQVRLAGLAWDGQDLTARARFDGAGDPAFLKSLEVRWFVDGERGTRVADVLTYGGDAGTVFLANTATVAGALAYGTVEARDARLRTALQAALALAMAPGATVEEIEPLPMPKVEVMPVSVGGVDWAEAPRAVAARGVGAARGGREERPAVRKELVEELDALSAEVDALAAKISSTELEADDADVDSQAPTPRGAPSRGAAPKQAAAKTKTAPAAEDAPAAKPKKAAAKKKAAAAPKKAAAKKAAAAPKKAAAKKTTAKKASAASKKAAVKKTSAAPKKTAAKKTAAASKKVAVKKATAKKAAAAPKKKAAAKKTAAAPKKKAAAKKK